MKLALGTVQFGLDYGVTNTSGQLSAESCSDILALAKKSGLKILATAAAYGESEEKLGKLISSNDFSVISKIPPLSNAAPEDILQHVETSLARLQRSKLEGLLLHDEQDLLGEKAEQYYNQLASLKTQGLVNKIGVSFYTVEAAEVILKRFDIDLIQIPANHLDRRFEKSGILTLAKSKGVEVHARSLFLQGLLAVYSKDRPTKFQGIKELKAFDSQVNNLALTPLQLALSYLTETTDIDYAIVGCLSAKQLEQIVEAYNFCKKFDLETLDLSTDDLSLINPVNW